LQRKPQGLADGGMARRSLPRTRGAPGAAAAFHLTRCTTSWTTTGGDGLDATTAAGVRYRTDARNGDALHV